MLLDKDEHQNFNIRQILVKFYKASKFNFFPKNLAKQEETV